jgi:hypothetical protein
VIGLRETEAAQEVIRELRRAGAAERADSVEGVLVGATGALEQQPGGLRRDLLTTGQAARSASACRPSRTGPRPGTSRSCGSAGGILSTVTTCSTTSSGSAPSSASETRRRSRPGSGPQPSRSATFPPVGRKSRAPARRPGGRARTERRRADRARTGGAGARRRRRGATAGRDSARSSARVDAPRGGAGWRSAGRDQAARSRAGGEPVRVLSADRVRLPPGPHRAADQVARRSRPPRSDQPGLVLPALQQHQAGPHDRHGP